jgi:hypothetical protein
MSDGPLIWVTGASQGIGKALIQAVPWQQARVIGVSRKPRPAPVHVTADLAEPSGWDKLEASLNRELHGFFRRPGGVRPRSSHHRPDRLRRGDRSPSLPGERHAQRRGAADPGRSFPASRPEPELPPSACPTVLGSGPATLPGRGRLRSCQGRSRPVGQDRRETSKPAVGKQKFSLSIRAGSPPPCTNSYELRETTGSPTNPSSSACMRTGF